MISLKSSRLKIVKEIVLFVLAGTVMTYFICPACSSSISQYMRVAFYSSAMWIVLWKGNALVTDYVSSKVSWIDYPVKRFIWGLITTIVFTLAAVYALILIFAFLFDLHLGSGLKPTIYFSVGITIFISLILHNISFLKFWRQAALNAAKLENESIAARYESLKNQVNPHFLFNTLNALSNLVYEDQHSAVKFIKQMSEVYRYVLDTRDREVVSLEEELRFLESYLFLQKIRFGEKLIIDDSRMPATGNVAPLALQMLIENAIKHNIVSAERPLHIYIHIEKDYIVVSNVLQRKLGMGETSSGLGLENICRRYEFLSDKPVIINEDAGYFTVKLPVLN